MRASYPFIEQLDMGDATVGLDGNDKSSRGDIVPPQRKGFERKEAEGMSFVHPPTSSARRTVTA